MTKRQDISSRRSRDEKLRDKEQEQLLKALQTSIDDYSSYQKSTCFQNYSDFLTVFSSWQCPYRWHKIVQDKVTLFKLEIKPAPIITHSVIADKDLNVKTYMYSQELLLNSGNIKTPFLLSNIHHLDDVLHVLSENAGASREYSGKDQFRATINHAYNILIAQNYSPMKRPTLSFNLFVSN
ncbi:unnamed protein product [Acanthoscelides obtectus]|uniref:Uncharacterized protein n=1 Tax=Acanthoscelides obtectus TaxID=200917 RepID=A0A9P0PDJ4_ACAOB|nr:unnamed protein product [Acanthoscelides obtectus]CAK1657355.1 hypothetical protein AOBTE_LOCUS20303 [Acanthoscelides obtectus]